MEKKYYNIFSNTNSFVDDVLEFSSFLDNHKLTSDDKINILIYTLKNNYNEYIKEKN